MTLKDKLPDRLKCSPLLTMESDSDIETIAESIVNLSDSDGDFFKKTEKLLLMACLGYLRDWCEPSQRTIGNLISLLDAALHRERGLCTGEHHRHRQPQRRIHRFRNSR